MYIFNIDKYLTILGTDNGQYAKKYGIIFSIFEACVEQKQIDIFYRVIKSIVYRTMNLDERFKKEAISLLRNTIDSEINYRNNSALNESEKEEITTFLYNLD